MDKHSGSPPAFPLFSKLPLELREQIWYEALPSAGAPALYFYRKWCLGPGSTTSDDELESDHTTAHPAYATPRNVQLDAPSLSLVSHEARRTLVRWMRDHRAVNRGCRGGQNQIFVRDFDSSLDIVCVPSNKWLEFLVELFDRRFLPNRMQVTVESMDIKNLALSHILLDHDLSQILAVNDILSQIEVLIVVLNMPVSAQGLLTPLDDSWRLKPISGWELHWNPQTFNFEPENHRHVCSQKDRELFEAAVTGIQKTLINVGKSITQLEIRAAYISQ
ncbi:unnamed protein product [Clonostachys rosea]|uniref:2EXR domain-containing protein n=1 Tax=Bionectria ochroleuca TaxID=29856 RepID=A0ABY6UYH4_BIOOC|nr:unnamed protein product [Clonostachys rosea]